LDWVTELPQPLDVAAQGALAHVEALGEFGAGPERSALQLRQ
jgi:hypothetical protein